MSLPSINHLKKGGLAAAFCSLFALSAFVGHAQSATQPAYATTQQALLIPDYHNANHDATALSTRMLPLSGNTWGYDIMANGKVLIHQDAMPGKDTGIGFATKADAEKVAAAIINLLVRGDAPPFMTLHQINAMGIR